MGGPERTEKMCRKGKRHHNFSIDRAAQPGKQMAAWTAAPARDRPLKPEQSAPMQKRKPGPAPAGNRDARDRARNGLSINRLINRVFLAAFRRSAGGGPSGPGGGPGGPSRQSPRRRPSPPRRSKSPGGGPSKPRPRPPRHAIGGPGGRCSRTNSLSCMNSSLLSEPSLFSSKRLKSRSGRGGRGGPSGPPGPRPSGRDPLVRGLRRVARPGPRSPGGHRPVRARDRVDLRDRDLHPAADHRVAGATFRTTSTRPAARCRNSPAAPGRSRGLPPGRSCRLCSCQNCRATSVSSPSRPRAPRRPVSRPAWANAGQASRPTPSRVSNSTENA